MNIGKPMQFSNKNINRKNLRDITTKIMEEIAKLSNQKYEY